MPRKVNFPVRLAPDVIDRINSLASSQNIQIQDLLCNALDAFEREAALPITLMERFDLLQENLVKLITVLQEKNEVQQTTADRIQRTYNLSNLILGWGEMLLEKGADGEKKLTAWQERKTEILASLRKKEEAQHV